MKHYEQMKSDQEKLTMAMQLQTALEKAAALQVERDRAVEELTRCKQNEAAKFSLWLRLQLDRESCLTTVSDIFEDLRSLTEDDGALLREIDAAIAARREGGNHE